MHFSRNRLGDWPMENIEPEGSAKHMSTDIKELSNVIGLDHHPRAWTQPSRVERFLRDKRVDPPTVQAAVRFTGALPPLEGTLPRSWTAPLIASLPERPSMADLQVSVAGAARYFEYLDALGALPRDAAVMCEYDLLLGAHTLEELILAGFERERMVCEERQGAAEKVQRRDALVAQQRDRSIAGDVSWLGGWVHCRGTWVVLWVPAGGGVAVAGTPAAAAERAQTLALLYMDAFVQSAERGRAPARLAVFSAAQERAMRGLAQQIGRGPSPLYRLRASAPLRFWAEELVLG